MSLWLKSGIYKILNKINGKLYIGSAVNLSLRWSQHKYNLIKNKHVNPHLQRSWNKHGENNFVFLIIEEITKENLVQREQYWIDFFNSSNDKTGYNIRLNATSNVGLKWTEHHKKKISESKKGRKQSVEEIAIRVAANTGKKRTQEFKEKMSLLHKGRVLSEEHKKKMSDAKKGKPSGRRNFDKWPCPNGNKCGGEVCYEKRKLLYSN